MCTTTKHNPVSHTYSSIYSKLIPQDICEQTEHSKWSSSGKRKETVTNHTLHTCTFKTLKRWSNQTTVNVLYHPCRS